MPRSTFCSLSVMSVRYFRLACPAQSASSRLATQQSRFHAPGLNPDQTKHAVDRDPHIELRMQRHKTNTRSALWRETAGQRAELASHSNAPAAFAHRRPTGRRSHRTRTASTADPSTRASRDKTTRRRSGIPARRRRPAAVSGKIQREPCQHEARCRRRGGGDKARSQQHTVPAEHVGKRDDQPVEQRRPAIIGARKASSRRNRG